ncbi:MAG: hypothetical protein JNK72_06045 [Myxococcales bacterium]|nr:hypothetical protein [Myxococcales bacterium]
MTACSLVRDPALPVVRDAQAVAPPRDQGSAESDSEIADLGLDAPLDGGSDAPPDLANDLANDLPNDAPADAQADTPSSDAGLDADVLPLDAPRDTGFDITVAPPDGGYVVRLGDASADCPAFVPRDATAAAAIPAACGFNGDSGTVYPARGAAGYCNADPAAGCQPCAETWQIFDDPVALTTAAPLGGYGDGCFAAAARPPDVTLGGWSALSGYPLCYTRNSRIAPGTSCQRVAQRVYFHTRLHFGALRPDENVEGLIEFLSGRVDDALFATFVYRDGATLSPPSLRMWIETNFTTPCSEEAQRQTGGCRDTPDRLRRVGARVPLPPGATDLYLTLIDACEGNQELRHFELLYAGRGMPQCPADRDR